MYPIILPEHKPVIEWAKKMKESHYNTSHILGILLADKPDKRFKKDEEYLAAREIFHQYGPTRDNVVTAITIDHFRLSTDLREGHLVTNGDMIGYAYNVCYKRRVFDLFVNKKCDRYVGCFSLDEFWYAGRLV